MTTRDDEHAHQAALFQWAKTMQRQYPELRWLHASQNGMAARSPVTARRATAAGMRKGVPDIHLPVPRNGAHGLWIELKRPGKHSVSPEQREWLAGLAAMGYAAHLAVGWEAARELIVDYLTVRP